MEPLWSITLVLLWAAGAGSPCQLLDGLDRERADAYRHQDRAALAALYSPDSAEGATDLARLDEYRDRGVAVRDLRVERRTCIAVEPGGVLVTERLLSTAAVLSDGSERTLPGGQWSDRLIQLEFGDGRWRIVEVAEAVPWTSAEWSASTESRTDDVVDGGIAEIESGVEQLLRPQP